MTARFLIEDELTPEGVARASTELERVAAAVASLAAPAPRVRPPDGAAEVDRQGPGSVPDALDAARRKAEEDKVLRCLELVRSLRTTRYWRLMSAAYRLQSKSRGCFSMEDLARASSYKVKTVYVYKEEIELKAQMRHAGRAFWRSMQKSWRLTEPLFEAMRRHAAASETKPKEVVESSAVKPKAAAG